jgi:hypothetical protein
MTKSGNRGVNDHTVHLVLGQISALCRLFAVQTRNASKTGLQEGSGQKTNSLQKSIQRQNAAVGTRMLTVTLCPHTLPRSCLRSGGSHSSSKL